MVAIPTVPSLYEHSRERDDLIDKLRMQRKRVGRRSKPQRTIGGFILLIYPSAPPETNPPVNIDSGK